MCVVPMRLHLTSVRSGLFVRHVPMRLDALTLTLTLTQQPAPLLVLAAVHYTHYSLLTIRSGLFVRQVPCKVEKAALEKVFKEFGTSERSEIRTIVARRCHTRQVLPY